MTKQRKMRGTGWLGLLTVSALGAAACGSDDHSANTQASSAPVASAAASTTTDGASASASTVAEATAAGSGPTAAIFEDPFDDDRNGWGILEDSEFGSATYEDGDYVWDFSGSLAHWIPEVLGAQYDRGELDMLDVIVRTEATILTGGGVIGVFCRETPDADAEWQWYEFVARDGYAAIRQADSEGNIEVLAETEDVALPTGQPIDFEAGCVDDASGAAQLSLTLNGALVLDAVDDDPLGNGVSGIQAWTFPQHEPMDVRWHEFAVHRAAP